MSSCTTTRLTGSLVSPWFWVPSAVFVGNRVTYNPFPVLTNVWSITIGNKYLEVGVNYTDLTTPVFFNTVVNGVDFTNISFENFVGLPAGSVPDSVFEVPSLCSMTPSSSSSSGKKRKRREKKACYQEVVLGVL